MTGPQRSTQGKRSVKANSHPAHHPGRVLDLAPVATGFPPYSVTWSSMAWTSVTGLATATVPMLFVAPVLWDLLMTLQARLKKRRA